MTDGRQTREFNYVGDLAAGFVAALATPGNEGSVINLGCGQDVSIRDLTTLVLELMGDPIRAQLGALPHRPTEIWSMFCDNTRARERLGWAPAHDLRDGLAKTIEWYRSEWEAGNPLLRPGRS